MSNELRNAIRRAVLDHGRVEFCSYRDVAAVRVLGMQGREIGAFTLRAEEMPEIVRFCRKRRVL
jgi:hypothetical protein